MQCNGRENNEKRILPSRSGDDGAPCAIVRLVMAQARISNQRKPKHKNQYVTIYNAARS